MRDRLIWLIRNAKAAYRSMNDAVMSEEEFIADFILADGVIVPPCKVGDTVYYTTSVDTEKELNVTDIFCGTVLSVAFDGKDIWIAAKYTNGLYYYHTSKDFGKTVFLTREEAEAKLKEGKG